MDIIEVLRDLIFYLGLMTPQCFESLVVDLDFSNVACIKLAVSKALGLGIVVGSSLVKLPQVLKIAGSGSADGISFMGVLLELIAITFSGVYSYSNNFPFSAYGESVFLAIQTTIIGLLVVAFSQGKVKAILFGALYAGELKESRLEDEDSMYTCFRRSVGPDEPSDNSSISSVVWTSC